MPTLRDTLENMPRWRPEFAQQALRQSIDEECDMYASGGQMEDVFDDGDGLPQDPPEQEPEFVVGKNYVYFICTSDMLCCKIGFSKDPGRRVLSGLQTGNPKMLVIVHAVEFDSVREARSAESMLHQAFGGRRLRGEWFDYGGALRALVESRPSADDLLLHALNA